MDDLAEKIATMELLPQDIHSWNFDKDTLIRHSHLGDKFISQILDFVKAEIEQTIKDDAERCAGYMESARQEAKRTARKQAREGIFGWLEELLLEHRHDNSIPKQDISKGLAALKEEE